LFNFKAFGYSDEIDYSIEPLAHSTFHNATLNALLKSVEEPPENTTFVFLVKSKEDILPTIVSRCLVFKLSSGKNELNYNSILNIIAKYPNIQNQDVYEMLENIENYLVQNQITLEEFLNMFLVYLKDLLLNNSSNSDLAQKIGNDIKIINQAIKHSRANIQNKHVIECMLLRLARGF
jgi:DNA polymerase III gamma/tau subunit